MQVRVLGCSGGIGARARTTSFLVDHDILVDAGTGVEDLSVEEVSEALGLPQATVRTRFFRARGLLREGLARDVDRAVADAFSFDGERCDRIVATVMAQLGAHGKPRGA